MFIIINICIHRVYQELISYFLKVFVFKIVLCIHFLFNCGSLYIIKSFIVLQFLSDSCTSSVSGCISRSATYVALVGVQIE